MWTAPPVPCAFHTVGASCSQAERLQNRNPRSWFHTFAHRTAGAVPSEEYDPAAARIPTRGQRGQDRVAIDCLGQQR